MNVYNNSWKYSYCFRMTEYILKLKSLQCFFFFFIAVLSNFGFINNGFAFFNSASQVSLFNFEI